MSACARFAERSACVHVTDGAGRFAPLTPDGRGDVGPQTAFLECIGSGSARAHQSPGDTRGSVLSLGTDYDLSSPGTYTVVVVREVDFIAVLLAKPLRLKVEKGPTVTEAAGAAPPVSGPVEPGDREWSELAARAGQPAGSFRLEVVPPSVHAGGLYLVASLICIDPKARRGR